tara:strand:- start:357 stop:1055 length:699 start_codon:yes stop_codon:yes gene_type:complete
MKIALVSGASKGIGLSIKKKFEENGILAVGISRNKSKIKNHKICDVRSEKDIIHLVDELVKKYKKIDILVNNAGIVTTGDIFETNLNEWNEVISTNLTGAYLLSKYVLKNMIKNENGKIINISSIAGRALSKVASAEYTCSKYGLIGLTKQLAYKYAKYNINVNCVCPSQTNTEMLENNIDKKTLSKIIDQIPARRLANPNEIADLVYFLASEKSNYINGTAIDINGAQVFV